MILRTVRYTTISQLFGASPSQIVKKIQTKEQRRNMADGRERGGERINLHEMSSSEIGRRENFRVQSPCAQTFLLKFPYLSNNIPGLACLSYLLTFLPHYSGQHSSLYHSPSNILYFKPSKLQTQKPSLYISSTAMPQSRQQGTRKP